MEEKEFDQGAMRKWCLKELIPGAQTFKNIISVKAEFGLHEADKSVKADFYSLGYVAAIGFLTGMFERGEEASKFEIFEHMLASFDMCLEREGREDED